MVRTEKRDPAPEDGISMPQDCRTTVLDRPSEQYEHASARSVAAEWVRSNLARDTRPEAAASPYQASSTTARAETNQRFSLEGN